MLFFKPEGTQVYNIAKYNFSKNAYRCCEFAPQLIFEYLENK